MRSKRLIVILVAVMMAFGLFAACGGKGSAIKVTSLTLGLDGTGTEAAPYTVTMAVGNTQTFPVTVNPTNASDKGITWSVTAGTQTGLSVTAESAAVKVVANAVGSYTVKGASKDGGATVFIGVTVQAEATKVERIAINTDEGDGTLASPHLIAVANTQTTNVNYSVMPSNATDKAVNWTVKNLQDDALVDFAAGEAPVTINTAVAGKLGVTGTKVGEAYLVGTSKDGGATVYAKVSVTDYTAVTAVTSTTLAPTSTAGYDYSAYDEKWQEYDYVFETVKGTKWDMSDGELARKAQLLEGKIFGGLQKPYNATYYPLLSTFGINVAPSDASNANVNVSYRDDGIISVLPSTGSWEIKSAGTTVVTVASEADPTKKMTVLVVVHDALYNGIAKSAYDELPVWDNTAYGYNWDFDADHATPTQVARLSAWQLVVMQSATVRKNIASSNDSNIKVFYLGESARPYGVDLEGNVSANIASTDVSEASMMMWTKVALGANVATLELKAGANDKNHISMRVIFVDGETGAMTTLSDWYKFGVSEEKNFGPIAIPDALKGRTGALVIEQKLGEKNNNGELMIKKIKINNYVAVTSVEVTNPQIELGQGGTAQINATVAPADATVKGLGYEVFATPADAKANGVTVNANGVITVASDATVGIYTIRVKSAENAAIFKDVELEVHAYTPMTGFTVGGFANGGTYSAAVGDAAIAVNITFLPADASIQTFTVASDKPAVVAYEGGKLVLKGAGTAVITITSDDANAGLSAVTFTITVAESQTLVEGSFVSVTEAVNTQAVTDISNTTKWNYDFIASSHGNAKAPKAEGSDGMLFESHSNDLNAGTVAQAWIKASVGKNQSFVIGVRAHGDNRYLESSNFRILAVVDLDGTPVTVSLLGWTTVMNKNVFQDVSVDVSAYQDQDIVLIVEQTASFANNKFPANSGSYTTDSGAAAYLWVNKVALSATAANPASQSTAFVGVNASAKFENGWSVSGNTLADKNERKENVVLNYTGAADGILALSVLNQYDRSAGMFVAYGLFSALDNDYNSAKVSFAVKEGGEDVISLSGNTLTALSAGTATLLVKMPCRVGAQLSELVLEVVVNVTIA